MPSKERTRRRQGRRQYAWSIFRLHHFTSGFDTCQHFPPPFPPFHCLQSRLSGDKHLHGDANRTIYCGRAKPFFFVSRIDTPCPRGHGWRRDPFPFLFLFLFPLLHTRFRYFMLPHYGEKGVDAAVYQSPSQTLPIRLVDYFVSVFINLSP